MDTRHRKIFRKETPLSDDAIDVVLSYLMIFDYIIYKSKKDDLEEFIRVPKRGLGGSIYVYVAKNGFCLGGQFSDNALYRPLSFRTTLIAYFENWEKTLDSFKKALDLFNKVRKDNNLGAFMGRLHNSYKVTWLLKNVPGEIMEHGFKIREYHVMVENLCEELDEISGNDTD